MIVAPIVQAITGSMVLIFISLIIFAVGISIISFDIHLVLRLLVLAFMGIAIIAFVSIFFWAEAFYDLVLKVLNSYTDPVQREFLPDPAQAEAARHMISVESKSEMGSQLLEFIGYISFVLGVIPACLGVLLKFTSRFRGLIGIGLSMVAVGLFLLLPFALPEYVLNEVIQGGTSSVPWLYWPLFALDTVSYIGGIIMWLGVFAIILGVIDRYTGRGENGRIKMVGLVLVEIGALGFLCQYLVLEGFLIPKARQIGMAVTGDPMFLSDWSTYPGWLKLSINMLDLWWIALLLGIIVFLAGCQIVRRVGSAAEETLDAISNTPEQPPSSGSPSESSDSSNQQGFHGGAAQQANEAARQGGRGGRGGRGR